MRTRIASVVTAAALLAASSALADPALGPRGEPGAVTRWETSGKTVTLFLAEGYEAETLADALRSRIRGVSAKAGARDVVVTGVSEAELLRLLESVDLPGGGDDFDEMLSALQSPGGEEDGSGSSIRATKRADFSSVKGPPGALIYGKVTKVEHARFPYVVLTVKLTKTPKRAVKGLKRGRTIRVLPRVKAKGGVVDPKDDQSQLNVGAWYAQTGDTVKVRLEPAPKKGLWLGKAFERVE